MRERQPLPSDLKIVAWLFLFWGGIAAIEMAAGFAFGLVQFNLNVLCLVIGSGLLRYSKSARKCAVVVNGFTLVMVPLIIFTALYYGTQTQLSLFGLEHAVPAPWSLAIGLAIFLLTLWEYRVLTRASVRALFRNPYRAATAVASTLEPS